MLVADSHQRRGVGTLLLEHLAALARQAGMRSFVADTLADNGLMQRVFTDAGFHVERHSDLDVTHASGWHRPHARRRSMRSTCASGPPTWRACGTCWHRSRSSSGGERPAGLGRRCRPAQHHRRPLPRDPPRGEPQPPPGAAAAGLSVGAGAARAGRPRDRRGPRSRRGAGDPRLRRARHTRRGRPLRRLRRDRHRRCRAGAATAAHRARGRRPAWSPTSSASPCGPRTCGSTPRSGRPHRRPARSASPPSPGRWASACWPRPPTGTSGCPASSRSATSST